MVQLHEFIIIISVILLLSTIMIIGTFLRWKFLVDPPESWKGYSHTHLKKIFGKEFLIPYNYVVGTLGIIISICIIIVFLKQ